MTHEAAPPRLRRARHWEPHVPPACSRSVPEPTYTIQIESTHLSTCTLLQTWPASSAVSSRVVFALATHLNRSINMFPGEIPSMKLFESDKTFAFLDINPLSYGHAVLLAT